MNLSTPKRRHNDEEEKENNAGVVFTPVYVGTAPPTTPRRAYKKRRPLQTTPIPSAEISMGATEQFETLEGQSRRERGQQKSYISAEHHAQRVRLSREDNAAARLHAQEAKADSVIRDIQSCLKSHKWTLYQFWSALLKSREQQISATASRFLTDHGLDLLEDITQKRPDIVDHWAKDRVRRIINKEGKSLVKSLSTPAGNSFTENIESFSLSGVELQAKCSAPTLWTCIQASCTEEGQSDRRNRDLVCISSLCMLAFARSERANYFQLIMGFWMLASGASRSQFGVLHHAGFCVCYQTAINYFTKLSDDRIKFIRELVNKSPVMLVWDNLCLKFDVHEEREDNKSKFLNGTTASVVELHGLLLGDLKPEMLPPRIVRRPVLDYSFEDTFPSQQQIQGLEDAHLFHVIDILFEFFPFLRARFKSSHTSPVVERIPVHKTAHHSLPFMPIEESSLVGTTQVIDSIVQDTLNLDDAGLCRQGIVVCNGDLLTTSLLDTVSATRRCDVKLVDNYSKWADKLMGILHTRMSGAKMVANEFWGKPNGREPWSLWKVNTLLARKPIVCGWKASKSAPFPQISELMLKLSLPANVIDGFRLECEDSDLENWAKNVGSYEEVTIVARRVLDSIASRVRVHALRDLPEEERDRVLENIILFNADALTLMEIRAAVREGDIGRVINVLAHWMVEFRGTGSMPKYADALFETLFHLKKMHPIRRKAHVMNWLVNMSGKPGHFKEVDLLQEHENYYTKIVYAARGSNKSISWLRKVTLCLWSLRSILTRVNSEYQVPFNSSNHSSPNARNDIEKLLGYLETNHIQSYVQDRPNNNDVSEARDFLTLGAQYSNVSNAFNRFNVDTRQAKFKEDSVPISDSQETQVIENYEEEADEFYNSTQSFYGTVNFDCLEYDNLDPFDSMDVSADISRCFAELTRS